MDFIPQFTAVGAVLSLLGLTLWWLRRRGFAAVTVKRSGGRRLACLERLPLSPQHTLHLVRVGSRLLLVSSSPAGCSVVERVQAAELESVE
jgi:flagellar biogenesis protein FliO